MIIEKLSDCKGATKFGTCAECRRGQSEIGNLYRLKFAINTSICLCEDCLKNVYISMNDILHEKHSENIEDPNVMRQNIRRCERCGTPLCRDNNKCGFEICDDCNDILDKEYN